MAANDDFLITLSRNQLRQILKRGYTYAMSHHKVFRINKNDIELEPNDLARFLESEKARENEQRQET